MKKIDLEMVRVWLEEIQYAALLQAMTNFQPFEYNGCVVFQNSFKKYIY